MREHTDGDFPFANDFNAVAQALADEAVVISGCSVSDGDTNDMTVDVASGAVRINGSKVSVGVQSVSLPSSDSSDDRYDLVVVGTDGTAEAVTGTASSTPKAPSIPADHALLAIVLVSAGTSGVTDDEIFDVRGINPVVQRFEDHRTAGNPHGSSVSDSDLTDHAGNSSAHHSRYSDSEARTAVNGSNVDIAGDADTVDGLHASDLQPTYSKFSTTVSNGSKKFSLDGRGFVQKMSFSGGVSDYTTTDAKLYYNDGSTQTVGVNTGPEHKTWHVGNLSPPDGVYCTDIEFIAHDNYSYSWMAYFIVF